MKSLNKLSLNYCYFGGGYFEWRWIKVLICDYRIITWNCSNFGCFRWYRYFGDTRSTNFSCMSCKKLKKKHYPNWIISRFDILITACYSTLTFIHCFWFDWSGGDFWDLEAFTKYLHQALSSTIENQGETCIQLYQLIESKYVCSSSWSRLNVCPTQENTFYTISI